MSEFITLAFTSPDLSDSTSAAREMADCYRLIESGAVDFLHLRKPGASADEMESLLTEFPSEFLSRVTLHSHFPLAEKFAVGGFHLNSRWPHVDESLLTFPSGCRRRLSCSMHSLGEIENYLSEEKRGPSGRYTYVTLSPIFDSISKSGYSSAFSLSSEQVLKALVPLLERMEEAGSAVVALGGVTPQNFKTLAEFGFGGAAMLGYLWNTENGDIREIERNIIHNKICYSL